MSFNVREFRAGMERLKALGLIAFPRGRALTESQLRNQIYRRARNETPAGHVPLKEWLQGEADQHGVTISAIYNRYARGGYPGLQIHAINKRVKFVKVK